MTEMWSVVLNEDCMNALSVFAARNRFKGEWDIAVVDPVYGIDGNSHRKNEGRGKVTKSKNYPPQLWDQPITGDDYFKALFRVSKKQIIFGGNYFPAVCGTPFKTPRRREYQEFIEQHPTNWIIWDKVNGSMSFNDCELIWVSEPIPTEVFFYMWSGMMQGLSFKRGSEMNPIKDSQQKRIHPTEKPIEVYKYLHTRFSKPGDNVLDTHVGSGSQRIVCDMMGLHYTGFELVKKYFDDQEERYKWYKSQPTLKFE